jgi:hypothetical protein
MDIFPKIILGPDPLVLHFPTAQDLNQDPDDFGSVELIPRRSSGVIAEIVEDPKVPWGEDKLNAVFNRLCLGLRDGFIGCRIRLPHLFGPAKDVIPVPGERIFA